MTPFEAETRYVVGFAFTYDFSHVMLMWKNRPAWQEGKLNGVGGKIEVNETPEAAMIREFQEETGMESFDWKLVGMKHRPPRFDREPGSYEVHIFACSLDDDDLEWAAENYENDESLDLFELDLEEIAQNGVDGLGGLVDMSIGALLNGFKITIEDPPLEVEEIDDQRE